MRHAQNDVYQSQSSIYCTTQALTTEFAAGTDVHQNRHNWYNIYSKEDLLVSNAPFIEI